MQTPKKIAIIASAGGSAFFEALKIVQAWRPEAFQFFLMTDRPCGAEDLAKAAGIPWHRIEGEDNDARSRAFKETLDGWGGVDWVLTFYSRLVTQSLYDHYLTLNIHPALLPAFPGIGSVGNAMRKNAKFLGATLHRVDGSVDDGPYLAQVCSPLLPDASEAQLNKMSFIQKVYLTLVLLELLFQERVIAELNIPGIAVLGPVQASLQANPCLQSPLLVSGLKALEGREGTEVFRDVSP